jgi:hypothetical protein
MADTLNGPPQAILRFPPRGVHPGIVLGLQIVPTWKRLRLRIKFAHFVLSVQVSASRQRTANSVIALLEKQARDSQRSENREEKERLAALRMNDEDGCVSHALLPTL